jgi:hypothetical protein
LREFFDLSDGHWHQKRLESEWQKAIEKSGKQRARRTGKGQQTLPFDVTAVEPEDNRAATSAVVEPRCDHPDPKGDYVSHQNPDVEVSLSESVAACEPEGEKHQHENPVGAQARLVDPPERCGTFRPVGTATSGSVRGRPPTKSPALKTKIKEQLRQKCSRYLRACRPAGYGPYWAAMMAGGDEAQRMLDATDLEMRDARWDDMAWWKRRQGLPVKPGTRWDCAPRAAPPGAGRRHPSLPRVVGQERWVGGR